MSATLFRRRHRKSSTQATFRIVPETQEVQRLEHEEVEDGCFSATFTRRLAAAYAAAEGKNEGLRATAKASAFVVAACAVVVFGNAAVPVNDPFLGGMGNNLQFVLYVLPFASFVIFIGGALCVVALIGVPVGPRCVMLASAAAAVTGTLCSLVVGFGFGVFPMPYGQVMTGGIASGAMLLVIYLEYPKALRADARFRRNVLRAVCIAGVVIGTAQGLTLFNAVFKEARGTPYTQKLLAVVLPLLKWGLKVGVKKAANGGDNPDFAHGAAYCIELCVSMVCAVMFTNLDGWQTFVLLLLMDLCVNLYYCIMITTVIIGEKDLLLKNKNRVFAQLRATLDDGGDLAAQVAAVKEAVGIGAGAGAVDGTSHDDGTAVANPRVAYLCANLYFAEMVEVLGPLVMGACSLVVYYVVPNDNRQHITYMDNRVGVTEDRFLQGMAYVLVDAVLEATTLTALVTYLRRVAGVDPMRVGWFIVQRHRAYYFWVHITMSVFFMATFLRHGGADTSFEFAWLAPGFVYNNSSNKTIATTLLWS